MTSTTEAPHLHEWDFKYHLEPIYYWGTDTHECEICIICGQFKCEFMVILKVNGD